MTGSILAILYLDGIWPWGIQVHPCTTKLSPDLTNYLRGKLLLHQKLASGHDINPSSHCLARDAPWRYRQFSMPNTTVSLYSSKTVQTILSYELTQATTVQSRISVTICSNTLHLICYHGCSCILEKPFQRPNKTYNNFTCRLETEQNFCSTYMAMARINI